MEDKRINAIKNNILRLFDDVMSKEGQYSMPYSTADDDYADWSVIFKIDRIKLWETEKYQDCKYSGTIYLEPIEIKVGFEGDWDYLRYVSDLPSWVEDDIKDSILDEIERYFSNVCVDVDFSYPKLSPKLS
jgi:hypothetical protein